MSLRGWPYAIDGIDFFAGELRDGNTIMLVLFSGVNALPVRDRYEEIML